MNLKYVAVAIVIMAAVGIGLLAFTGAKNPGSNTTPISNASAVTAAPAPTSAGAVNSSAVLFNSTQYARYAYLISSPTLSQQAKSALAGFNLTRTQLANNTVVIGLTPTGSNQVQDINVLPGEKLYFIETTFGDDGFGYDSSLGDDGVVLVNQMGMVVS